MKRDYYLLLVAAFMSAIGNRIYQLALPLLIYHITHKPLAVAATYALQYVPYALLSPFGGVAADRWDRRRLMVSADALSATVSLALGALLLVGIQSLWPIYAIAAVLAGVAPFYHPALQSMVPLLVRRADLTRATARLQGVESVIALAGPLVGGLVIVKLGIGAAITLNAASFAVAAAVVWFIRARQQPGTTTRGTVRVWGELSEALQYVRRDQQIWAATRLFAGINLAISLVQSNLIYYLAAAHFNASEIGLVIGAQGVGSIAGAALAQPLAKLLAPGRLILAATLCIAASTAALIPARNLYVLTAVWSLHGAAVTVTAVTWFTLRLHLVPDRLLGRVVALTRLAAFAAIPVGSVVGGVLFTVLPDVRLLIASASGLLIALAAAGLRTPLRRTGKTALPTPVTQ
jgi:MFS family permease